MRGRAGSDPGPGARSLAAFRRFVYAFYRRHGRHELPWRLTGDPYEILVSEIMLQQTQVARVLDKYPPFLQEFPDFAALAGAPLEEVLRAWQGLGYNRRGRSLWELAGQVTQGNGRLPETYQELLLLPGVGPATAAAVSAFAFGVPHAFLETNIRAVYLHHFFPGEDDVSDKRLLVVAEAALDRGDPRHWHYALMDYGSVLKKLVPNPSRRSRSHARPSPFEGSRRQLRGRLLRTVLAEPGRTTTELAALAPGAPRREVTRVLEELAAEGMLRAQGDRWRVA